MSSAGQAIPTLPNKTKIPTFLGIIAQIPFLLAAWGILYGAMVILTEILLVPWDMLPERPPVGTIARTVNDFFEGAPGAYLPATLVLSVSIALLIYRLINHSNQMILLEFAVTSIALPIFLIAAMILPAFIVDPAPYSPAQVGFRQNMPGIVMAVLILIPIFWLQWSGYLGIHLRKNKGDSE